MPEVWLIRHGESESNANLPTVHPATSVLTAKGLAESEAIADSFPVKPSLIVISPYVRAQQTAEPTLARFRPISQEQWPVQEFTFLDPIRYSNTTVTEREPHAAEYWKRNDPHFKDGGMGESFNEFLERVRGTLAKLRRHSADFIAVFSHGFFMRALVWSLLAGACEATPESMRRYRHFSMGVRIPNGAIFKARFTDGRDDYFTGFHTTHLATIRPGAETTGPNDECGA